MPFFVQSPAQFLAAPIRNRAVSRPNDNVDDFLSSDLENSFASTVSLNSPPKESIGLAPDSEYAEPMDISPAPPSKPSVVPRSRPRAFTSAARLFGNDMSNRSESISVLQPSPTIKTGSTSAKRTQRSALPTEWLSRPESHLTVPSSPDEDAMDVDSSFSIEPPPPAYSFPAPPQSAAPTVTSFHQNIDNLFYDSMSPRRELPSPGAPQPKKRRSLSPETTRHLEDEATSSPVLPSSPAQRKLERMASGSLLSSFSKPSLQGLGTPPSNAPKRPRRPALSAMVQPSDHALQSAYPVLSSREEKSHEDARAQLPPARRAFSAMLAPPSSSLGELSEDSSFDTSADMSSPAQAYAKRQQMKTIRRCDGTDDFRPLTGATAMVMNDSPSSKFLGAGLPGFGDNESHGKILPCHRVTEDGLMRITPETMDRLLDGKFEDKIRDFHVIDCRFDYEYAGGHIPGAVNINTTASVEELLLGPSLMKPRPSVSDDGQKKTVLIFHCEFSVKRAPTFAKHLRSKDRAMNNHIYPKIHYPELYILEGGYCSYFKRSAARCSPNGYVPMDDPQHAASRRGDLDQFRKTKFGRHRSYAYGDCAGKASLTSQQVKRKSAPSGQPALFAAGNAARSRRGGNGLSTLTEDGAHATDGEETDIDLGDSPCPPPTKSGALKSKKAGRAPLARAETYGPTRMAF